jgi:hypothetical protein
MSIYSATQLDCVKEGIRIHFLSKTSVNLILNPKPVREEILGHPKHEVAAFIHQSQFKGKGFIQRK